MPLDADRIERLRYLLELFIDGSDRTPAFAREIATEVLDAAPGDPLAEAFGLSAAVYGSPDAAFFRTEDEMRKECTDLRRRLAELGA